MMLTKLKVLKANTLIFLLLLTSCTNKNYQNSLKVQYPEIEHNLVNDNYFGKSVQDPYRIMEDVQNKEVVEWVQKEKNLTDSILSKINYRDSLKANLERVMFSSNLRGGFPRPVGNKLFYAKLFFKERIEKICLRDSLGGPEIEIFDTKVVNTPTIQYDIFYFEPSSDGKFIALGLSPNGTETVIIKILDVEKKTLLPETIERANYGNPSWLPNQNGFFYTQLKEIANEKDAQTMYEDATVKLHFIGSPPKIDQEIISKNSDMSILSSPLDMPFITIFPKTNTAVASVIRGSTQYISFYHSPMKFFAEKGWKINWNKICSSDEMVTAAAFSDEKAFILSFASNPNGTIKIYDLRKNGLLKEPLIVSSDEIIEDMIQTNNNVYIKKLKNGFSTLQTLNLQSQTLTDIKLPFSGYVSLKPPFTFPPMFSNSDNLYFIMESWNKELGGYVYDPKKNEVRESLLRVRGKYGNPTDIVVREVEAQSHDGEMVPLSIIYTKDLKLDGNNPTLLEAYGSYGISMNSQFDLATQVWLKMGGIYAVAHVRGGGEKGNSWYKGGFKKTKPNTWKDFIACAEYLIHEKYTSSEKLGVKGVSAGGIAVGRAVTERPDLFKAAILQVPELNSLRSENTNNTFSISEFGTTKDSSEFEYLYNMDVYHSIKDNIQYPSLLITGEVNDDLVSFWQPAKAVARFQEVSKNKPNIVLFKVGNGGHGGESDRIQNEVDIYSFLFWQLGDKRFSLKE